MKRKDKYNYAMELLKSHNVEQSGDKMRINSAGNIVIHSKQLKNCIVISPQATEKTIRQQIYMQLKIAHIY